MTTQNFTLNLNYLNACTFVAEKSGSRPLCEAIYLTKQENKLVYAATNGHIAIRIEEENPVELQSAIALPFQEVQKFIKTLGKNFLPVCAAELEGGRLTLKSENTQQTLALLDIQRPDIERVFAQFTPENVAQSRFNPDYLLRMQKAFQAASGEKNCFPHIEFGGVNNAILLTPQSYDKNLLLDNVKGILMPYRIKE